jgi:threonylcarbamoyladenosine tRNA methylthiotransferase MtaB
MKVAFHTLGCKVNQYETEAMSEQFVSQGYELVNFDEMADVYVINTCTVTSIADKKSRKMLSKAKHNNEQSVVVAVGCYVQLAHEELEDMPYIDVLIGNTNKDKIVEITEQYMETHQRDTQIEDVHHDVEYEELKVHTQLERTRVTVKIQDGCDQYCAYCIIPYTRGKVRSRQPEHVLEEIKALAQKGYEEFILTGIHIGSYGKDFATGDMHLIELLEAIGQIEGVKRIRLGSLEPNLLTDDFIARLSNIQAVCPHFHMSLQSGCDTVLQRMKRRYTTTDFMRRVDALREVYDKPAITTDIIVGFPGETDEEHEETVDFLAGLGFADCHVFKYSIRKGTAAANMKGQVDGNIKNQRSHELSELAESMKHEYLKPFISTEDYVLIEDQEQVDTHDYLVGYTTRYVKVYIENIDERYMGSEVKVLLTDFYRDGVLGVLC